MTTTAIGASRAASERRSESEFVQSNECEGEEAMMAMWVCEYRPEQSNPCHQWVCRRPLVSCEYHKMTRREAAELFALVAAFGDGMRAL